MKAQLLASAAIVALAAAGPALAADLPLKAPPPVVAAWNWSGFYVGGHAGYGWGRNSQTDINDPFFEGKFPNFGISGYDPKGVLGGVHAGANWQTGSIVAGLEGDLSFTDIKASSLNSVVNNIGGGIVSSGQAALSGTFDLLGSGRGRLGYLVSPNVLFYGTGGLAWTRYTENTDLSDLLVGPGTNLGQFSSASTTTWRLGWVAGLGVEARLLDTNWLARLEYLHYDFGNTGGSSSNPAVGFGPAGSIATRSSGDLTLDVVRAGLSYKFDPDRLAGYAPATSGGGLLYKAPAPAVAAWSWSGFYVGAHAGYGWARDPFDNLLFLDVVTLSGVDSRGFVGGFQTGANWQSGRVVGGLELDLSGTDIKGSTSNSVAVPGILSQASQSDKFDRLGSARARIGYLATPSVLLYATGGPGWARMVTDQETALTVPLATPPVTTTSLVTPRLFGWTAGAGVETRLWDSNWLARVEYLHYDFGTGGPSIQTVPAGPLAGLTSGHLTSDVVRAGLSYKLDWPGMARAGPAMMPAKAAPAAVWSWTGFYIGGHGGYGWSRDPSNQLIGVIIFPIVTPPVFVTGPNAQGGVGGFQAGANWQSGAVVGGLELDLSSTGIKGSSVGSVPTITQTDKFDLLGSARARLGYLVSPGILLYGTGGLAWTQLDQSLASTFGGSTTTTSTPSWKFGWTAGAGVQARLWNSNWIARVEYLHYDFGDSGASFSGFTDTGVVNFITSNMTSHHVTTDVVRAGVDYKLD